MIDIIDEVKEDLKRERVENLFKKYGGYAITLVVLAVGVTAGVTWYTEYVQKTQARIGETYRLAMQQAKQGEAQAEAALNQVIAEGGGGYHALAKLRKAALYIEQDRINEALTLYDDIIADPGVDIALRDLAAVRSVHLMMERGLGSDVDIDTRLAPLVGPLKPWRFLALELQAVHALKQDDNATALKLLSKIASDTLTPQHMRDRVSKMVEILATRHSGEPAA